MEGQGRVWTRRCVRSHVLESLIVMELLASPSCALPAGADAARGRLRKPSLRWRKGLVTSELCQALTALCLCLLLTVLYRGRPAVSISLHWGVGSPNSLYLGQPRGQTHQWYTESKTCPRGFPYLVKLLLTNQNCRADPTPRV